MLELTVLAGGADYMQPRRFHSAWVVRTGSGAVRTFSDATGAKLVRLGLIEPDSAQVEVPAPGGVTARRYVPTAAGLERARRGQSRVGE